MNVHITAQDSSDADEIKNTVTPPTPSSDESTAASSSSPKLDAVSALLKAAEIPTINPVATASPAAEAAEILAGMQVHLIGQQQLVETHPPVVKKRGRGRPRKDGTPARARKDKDKVAEMLLLLHGQDQKQPAAKKFKAATYKSNDNDQLTLHPRQPVIKREGMTMTTRRGGVRTLVTPVFPEESDNVKAKARPGTRKKRGAPPTTNQNKKGEGKRKRIPSAKAKLHNKAEKKLSNFTDSEKERMDAAIAAVNERYGTGAEMKKKLSTVSFRGVTCRPSGKWQAQVYYGGKSRYIGVFESKEHAALAYECAREVLKTSGSNKSFAHTDLCAHPPNDVEKTSSEIALGRKAAFAMVSGFGKEP